MICCLKQAEEVVFAVRLLFFDFAEAGRAAFNGGFDFAVDVAEIELLHLSFLI